VGTLDTDGDATDDWRGCVLVLGGLALCHDALKP